MITKSNFKYAINSITEIDLRDELTDDHEWFSLWIEGNSGVVLIKGSIGYDEEEESLVHNCGGLYCDRETLNELYINCATGPESPLFLELI